MSVFDGYVGIPYVERGRDRSGADCWGLLRMVFAELRGVELPSLAEDYVSCADRLVLADLIQDRLPAWQPIPAGCEAPFDAVLMRVKREACHIGLVVGRGLVLHADHGRDSCVEPYGSWRLAHRVVGFYRYANQDAQA